jgi:response regulator RpfG family c-di-GMP phosphodiesterase
MPVMNGIEMLEKLKAVPELKNIPVIMLTAESGKENVMNIVKMGVKDYIVKPFKDVQLIEKVKNVVSLQEKNPEESEAASIEKFFRQDGDFQFLTLPVKINRPTVIEIENSLTPTLKTMQSEGRDKLIVDLSQVGEINVSLVKLLVASLQKCQSVGIKSQVVGTAALGSKLKGFQETSWVEVNGSVDEAKAAFGA